jgi:hypothetical protein
MPVFLRRKTGLIIPYWEAKLCFYGLEYAERERKGVFEDQDFWNPGSGEIPSGSDQISPKQAYFVKKH